MLKFLRILIFFCVGVVLVESARFPQPNAPFYGLPFDGRGIWSRFLPFTLSGKCQQNASYVIRKMDDFFDHLPELECIFAGGRAPTRMPEGPLHATAITVLNFDSRIINPWVESFIWRGKYIQERECNGTKTFVGWNAWAQPLGATLHFIPRIRPHNLNLAVGEHQDKKEGIVVEYSNDVLKYCPELKEEIMASQGAGGVSAANAWSKNIPFMDFIRFIGRQDDGGDLYILKTYLRDWFRADRMAVTVAFTAVLNYDKKANPTAYPGIATKPLEKDFSFVFPGLADFLARGLPIDNLLLNPVQTWKQIGNEGGATRRSLGALLRDVPYSFGKIWNYNYNWLRSYIDDKDFAGKTSRPL